MRAVLCWSACGVLVAGCVVEFPPLADELDGSAVIDAGAVDAALIDGAMLDGAMLDGGAGLDSGDRDGGAADSGCAGDDGGCEWDLGIVVSWSRDGSCPGEVSAFALAGDMLRVPGVDLHREVTLCLEPSLAGARAQITVGGSPLVEGTFEYPWMLDATLPERRNELSVEVADRDRPTLPPRSYTLVADRVDEPLTATIPTVARAGTAVAISSDGRVVAVGAPDTTAGGAVFVYERAPSGDMDWATGTELTWDDAAAGSRFGAALALNADGSVLVVGAPDYLGESGGVFVFARRLDGAWDGGSRLRLASFTTRPEDDSDAGDDQLGCAVDVDDAGRVIVAGASGRGTATGSGSTGTFAIWTRRSSAEAFVEVEPTERPRASGGNTQLGAAIAISGDGRTLVVGVPNFDLSGGGNRSGRALVYARCLDMAGVCTELFAEVAALDHPEGTDLDGFGRALAVSADGATIVVGAGKSRNHGQRVWRYQRTGPRWTSTPSAVETLRSPVQANGDDFGSALALSPDGLTLAVGVPFEDGTGRGIEALAPAAPYLRCAGAVYLWRRAGLASPFGGSADPYYLKSPNTPTPGTADTLPSEACSGGLRFGSAVALSSDSRLIVGEPGGSMTEEGAAYSYW